MKDFRKFVKNGGMYYKGVGHMDHHNLQKYLKPLKVLMTVHVFHNNLAWLISEKDSDAEILA